MPLLAHAATATILDPVDATASATPTEAPSAFDKYLPFNDSDNASWQQLNCDVAPKRNGAMQHSTATGSASAEMSEHQHGSQAK